MEDILFNLKFTAKQFERASTKATKEEKTIRKKVKKAIEKGNIDGARIFAQNAIRKKSESLNYLRLAGRVDAVASRMDTAIKMNRVTKTMKSVVKGMDKVMENMDIDQISKVMDKFEKQFDDLDVRSQYMEDAMNTTTSLTTPEDEVNSLMAQIADEHNLTIQEQIDVPMSKRDEFQVQADDLSQRLAKLKSQNSS
eukprot:CAMPEP_0117438116 /NCGR_PEP_ID=MMETSP0759-20121206/1885_1 /TAXON_ID=63605 /ORGANISM="Percolomonas cosmopolitus, Strain WS" /LENGTH=195 /DNA_ID=CAMNT_0005229793 /DNA_START=122 /DNA_END=709 /DNA_ORIENTATION=+